jgi:toxin FitB
VLDTNVLSESLRAPCNEHVARWLTMAPMERCYTTAISEAEMRLGVQRLPEGRRKQDLLNRVGMIFTTQFPGRVLPFESNTAGHFAALSADRRTRGRPVPFSDALIAAICLQHRASLATRNIRDFLDCGIELINPWEPIVGDEFLG